MSLPVRPMGKQGLMASMQGYGTMGLAAFYGPALDDDTAVAILEKAYEGGVTHFDSAEMYAGKDVNDNPKHTDEYVGKFLKKVMQHLAQLLQLLLHPPPEPLQLPQPTPADHQPHRPAFCLRAEHGAEPDRRYLQGHCERSRRVQWIDEADLGKGFEYLYLAKEDYEKLPAGTVEGWHRRGKPPGQRPHSGETSRAYQGIAAILDCLSFVPKVRRYGVSRRHPGACQNRGDEVQECAAGRGEGTHSAGDQAAGASAVYHDAISSCLCIPPRR
eukprot:TRINITY_DN26381_c0_g3_i1.p1 TRINITY_DN26381_c0_g3~~TRINITY_DN26381_c0_g3_i1.p1  ORF type:complete len:272 (-),score=37.71 TRINITY_DN26381_c0_g3_i1:61-876(-)